MPSIAYPSRVIRAVDTVQRNSETCTGPVECLANDALAIGLIVVLLIILVPVLALAVGYLPAAIAVLETERDAATEERDTYRAFARRVASMDVERHQSGTPAREKPPPDAFLQTPQSAHFTSDPGLTRVVDAYRETVLADVEGADDDEVVVDDLAAEYGASLAETVTHAPTLTPDIRAAIVQSAREAIATRDRLVAALDREADALDAAERTFAPLADVERIPEGPDLATRSFDELRDNWEDLTALEAACERHLEQRQTAIHEDPFNRNRTTDSDAVPLQEYLYESIAVTFPVLATGTEVLRDVRAARRRVQVAFTQRA